MNSTIAFLLAALALTSPAALAMSKKAPVMQSETGALPPADADSIWVGKSDEAKSCAKEKGIALDTMSAELSSGGVKILAKRKVPDGKMRIQSCGADKGDLNGYLISRKDLDKAKELGFKPVTGNL